MLQQMAAQTGMPKEGLEKTLSMFATMTDDQLESSLKTVARVQKVTSTVQNTWKKTDQMVGGYLKPVLLGVVIVLVVLLVLYVLGGSSGDDQGTVISKTMKTAQKLSQDTMTTKGAADEVPTMATDKSLEDEFGDEF